jgi:hypothetical protein
VAAIVAKVFGERAMNVLLWTSGTALAAVIIYAAPEVAAALVGLGICLLVLGD